MLRNDDDVNVDNDNKFIWLLWCWDILILPAFMNLLQISSHKC